MFFKLMVALDSYRETRLYTTSLGLQVRDPYSILKSKQLGIIKSPIAL